MQRFPLSQLSDQALLCSFGALLTRDRTTTAELLAHIAEIDERKLYRPAAYSSMYAYCVGEFRFSEDVAFKRIKAARAARRFPAILDAVAEGRLHLSAVVLLAPHLTEDTADELLAAAAQKTKSEIEHLLAERFPQPGMMAWVEEIPSASLIRSVEHHEPAHVEDDSAPGHVEAQQAPGPVNRSKVKPLNRKSFAVQFTFSEIAHDKLRYARELLSHQIPSGDIAEIFERALDLALPHLEKRKFAATERPGPGRRSSATGTRHIPALVKRTVWARDGGQCTFVSEAGRRCDARKLLEFDHIDPVARQGEATVDGMRLRCRAHNQTLWNDQPAVVRSSRLLAKRPTSVARGHLRSRVSAYGARAAYERSWSWTETLSRSWAWMHTRRR